MTDEDIVIWCANDFRIHDYHGMTHGDRRDAEVMHRLGVIRHRFYVVSIMMLGYDKPTAPGILQAATRNDRDPGRAFELDYRP